MNKQNILNDSIRKCIEINRLVEFSVYRPWGYHPKKEVTDPVARVVNFEAKQYVFNFKNMLQFLANFGISLIPKFKKMNIADQRK